MSLGGVGRGKKKKKKKKKNKKKKWITKGRKHHCLCFVIIV